jgi:hypothetical protein
MRLVHPVVVGADQRPDHQHGSTGGTHETRQHRPDGQNGDIDSRAAVQVAANEDSAGHGIERHQQNDEGNVFGQQRMHQAAARQGGAEHGGKRQKEGQRPRGGDLAEMVVPERRREQRHQSD